MEKKTATERLLSGQDGFFAQKSDKDASQGEEEVGKPKSRSTNAFLESLKSQTEEQQ